jgi:predicted RecA/RadA family phage recombinase
MRNVVQDGFILTLTASRAVTSGQGMLRGNLFGVALADTANGVAGEFAVGAGVFNLPKAAQAMAEGVTLYWDNTAFNVTTTVGTNKLIGYCATVGGVASGVPTVDVRLVP